MGEDALAPTLGAIVLCEDVTDCFKPVNPTNYFPEGAREVWTHFTYANREPGTSWGRYRELDRETYMDSTEQSWEDGRFGWTAYAIRVNQLREGHDRR